MTLNPYQRAVLLALAYILMNNEKRGTFAEALGYTLFDDAVNGHIPEERNDGYRDRVKLRQRERERGY